VSFRVRGGVTAAFVDGRTSVRGRQTLAGPDDGVAATLSDRPYQLPELGRAQRGERVDQRLPGRWEHLHASMIDRHRCRRPEVELLGG